MGAAGIVYIVVAVTVGASTAYALSRVAFPAETASLALGFAAEDGAVTTTSSFCHAPRLGQRQDNAEDEEEGEALSR